MSSLLFDGSTQSPTAQHVLLATPAYENPDASYTFSIQGSRQALHDAGINSSYLLLSGNCHVDDARNTIIKEFLTTNCTDLVFLDADVSWEAESLVKLCQFEIGELDIVGGVYPYRRDGCDDIPVLNLTNHINDVEKSSELLEVAGLPTGFMRIRRPVVEKMAGSSTCYNNKAGVSIPLIFERTIRGGARYGGDIGFCLKAREQGGRVYSALEIRLGHTVKSVRWGSHASSLRALSNDTVRFVTHRIRHGGFTPGLLHEVINLVGNPYGAPDELLAVAIGLARKSERPILELGSGLRTVLMAAAVEPGIEVHCLEHSMMYAIKTQDMADSAGLKNIHIYVHPLVDDFYKVPEELPKEFSFMLIDGPPRNLGNRQLLTERLPFIPDTLLFDDADNPGFRAWADEYADLSGRFITMLPSERTMLMRASQ